DLAGAILSRVVRTHTADRPIDLGRRYHAWQLYRGRTVRVSAVNVAILGIEIESVARGSFQRFKRTVQANPFDRPVSQRLAPDGHRTVAVGVKVDGAAVG